MRVNNHNYSMTCNPNIHKRKSIRLKKYEYSCVGIYVITICVEDKVKLFGTIKNGEMQINVFGKIITEEWGKSEQIRTNFTISEPLFATTDDLPFHAD